MEEEADYHDIAPETEYYQDYQDLLRRRTGGERAADDEAKMGAVELSIQKLEGPLREYSDAKLQAYLDAHFDLSIWLVLRKRQWVSHRYGLFRRRLEKKEKEQREELRRKAMEWNAGLRAACVPWTPNEVFRSRDSRLASTIVRASWESSTRMRRRANRPAIGGRCKSTRAHR